MSKIKSRVLDDVMLAWNEFCGDWYSNRLGQYNDDPVEPTITDFMDWLRENIV